MIRILYGLVLLSSALSLPRQAQPQPAAQEFHFPKPPAYNAQTHFTIKPTEAPDHTWGYIIYMNSKPFIRQTSIPALPGNRGFSSRSRAQRAAELMVDKLRKGQMPPSLTKEELQQAKLI